MTNKLCTQCNIVKPLDEGFYRAGAYFQTLCKICMNNNRRDKNRPSVKIGFEKVPGDIRVKIINDFKNGAKFKTMYDTYVKVYPSLKYGALVRWLHKWEKDNILKNG